MDRMNFPEMEEGVLKFWEENKIFEKSLEINKESPRFVFYEGPPYANGKPGIHHILGRVFKDLFCRYKTMRRFLVERKAGWDTHGLPVEVQTEKELGFKTKKEIEDYGIAEFNAKCKENVWKYKDEWDAITKRIGFWLDLENPYITYENYYIESLWRIIKQIYDKGLLAQDYRVAPYCPRCGTTLSSHELAQGYKKVKENSIYIKFKVKSGQKIGDFTADDNTYFLVWTTTPWTLPGNVALAVNPDIDYVLVGNNSEKLILAKERLEVLGEEYEILQEFKGKDLLDWEYEPLYDFVKPDKPADSAGVPAYRVVAGDFVSTEEGTGIVHIAPAFGEDDMNVGKENNLPVLMTVDKEGRFIDEIKPWAGKFVKDADPEIIEELKSRNLLYKIEKYEHDYPFCWRCESPLLYYALTSWFVRMTEIKNKLIEGNKTIKWVPEYLKEGRFGEWLKEVKDWNFSRERYWGVPLPIWICQVGKNQKSPVPFAYGEATGQAKIKNQNYCDNIKVIGSIRELEDLGGKKMEDLHRPYVDEIFFNCEKCGGEMRRVPEVADIWFDSGAMPFARSHWPFGQNEKFTEPPSNYPADFICEGVDQTRGWFYTLLAVATLLGFEAPYKNVVSYGLVLDKNGKKMSKSKGNAVNARDIIDKFGVDALRWYFYTVNAIGMPAKFDENDVQRVFRRFIMTLWNTFTFWNLYSDGIQVGIIEKSDIDHTLDKWIFSKFNKLTKDVSEKLDKYDLVGAARNAELFLDDFSNWYLRLSRGRLKNKESEEARKMFSYILVNFVKITAPFIPFVSDYIFREITGKESVHLEKFPESGEIDEEIINKMEIVRKIVSIGLEIRAKAGIKVRQPLKQLAINMKLDKELLDLLKEELNIKEIIFNQQNIKENDWLFVEDDNFKVFLNTEITPELKKEGILREIIRNIQSLRKKAGLTPKDKVALYLYSDGEQISDIIEENKEIIKEETILLDMVFEKQGDFKASEEITVDGERLFIGIK